MGDDLMARPSKKLTAAFVRTVTKPGKYNDEHGLILRVMPAGSKHWLQRLTIHHKRCELGLGGYPLVSLAEARAVAFENRKLARAGGDPLALKQRRDLPTFEAAVEKVIAIHQEGWKDGGKSANQWRASLRDYAMSRLGGRRVDQITTSDVMAVLLPIWSTKRETARRVRQRLSAIFKWSVAQGYRHDNPAGDAIGAALPKSNGTKKHQRALPHAQVAGSIRTVQDSGAWLGTKFCFEFLVLTATRSGEARGARWEEIDFKARTWIVPAERMKMKREHRVPLSDRVLAILDEARAIADSSGLIFPSVTGKALSDATLSKLLREQGIKAVPHGFRSSFRNWAGETSQNRDAAERALAHEVKGVEGDYYRSDLFELRRALMQAWAAYLQG